MTKICSISGCENKHYGLGYCLTHWYNFKKHGNPLKKTNPADTRKKQSQSAIKRIERDGIWNKNETKDTHSSIKKQSETQTGMPKSSSHKANLSKAKRGKPSSIKGIPKSDVQKKKQSKSMKIHYKTNSVHNKGKTKKDYLPLDKMSKSLSKTKKKAVAEGTYKSPMKDKTHSAAANKKNSDAHIGKKASAKTRALLHEQRNTPEAHKRLQKQWRDTRKKMGRPNKPEKQIGEILSEVGIKYKFLRDISYKTIDNKFASKEMDIVWKDSMGNKKIIEYNGRYHFDPREHKPDEIYEVHNKPTKCQDLWDDEKMVLDQIRKEGYEILVVWQYDFLKDFENEKKRILKFANSETLS